MALLISMCLPLGLSAKTLDSSYATQIGYGMGYNASDEVLSSDLVSQIEPTEVSVTLPASYDMTDDISIQVENQGQTNICWSFSSLTMLETYIAKTYGEYYEFSAIHLATSKFVEDNENSGVANFFDASIASGSISNFVSYINHDAGPVLEEQMPFKSFYNQSKTATTYYINNKNNFDKLVTVDGIACFEANSTLTDEQEITNNRNQIKLHLTEKGACMTSIYMTSSLSKSSGSYYLPTTSSSAPNHAVTIIGWDDDYQVPGYENAGAWLVQNSWGSSYTYFYVSYSDQFATDCVYGINNATLTTPKQNTVSNIDNVSSMEFSFYSYRVSGVYLGIVMNVSDHVGEYITNIQTSILSASNKSDAYTFYINFTSTESQPTSSLTKIQTAPSPLSDISSSLTSFIGADYVAVDLDTPIKITNNYAVLVIKIYNIIQFSAYHSSGTATPTNQLFATTNPEDGYTPLADEDETKMIVPTQFVLSDTSTPSNIIKPIENKFGNAFGQNNSIAVGNTIKIPVQNPAHDINNVSIYANKYTSGSLTKTDYIDKFIISKTATGNISYLEITQKEAIDQQNYFCSFNIGDKIYKKGFHVFDNEKLLFPIDYHLADATNNSNNISSYNSETQQIKLYAPSLSGYDFVGWYLDSELSQSVSDTTEQDNIGTYVLYNIPTDSTELNFYPKWTLSSPTIKNQPQSISKTYDGKTSTLSLTVEHGLGKNYLTYQWYVSYDGSTWDAKVGETSATLNLTNVAESGKYKCLVKVSKNGETKTVYSSVAEVTITKAEYKNLNWNYTSPFSYNAQYHEVKVNNNYSDSLLLVYTNNKYKDAGEYIAKVNIVNNNDNYNTPTIDNLSWKIDKAELTIKLASFSYETIEGFDSFNESNCRHEIIGTNYDDFNFRVTYSIEATSNPNLKIINASYTPHKNYNVTVIKGELRRIVTSLSVSNDEIDITITRDNGYLINASLSATAKNKDELSQDTTAYLDKHNLTFINAYEIILNDDDSKNHEVGIKLSNADIDKDLEVYIITDDGIKRLESQIVDNYLIFNTENLGEFLIVEKVDVLTPKDILIGIAIIVGLIALIVTIIILHKHHKHKKYYSNRTSTPH